MKNINVIGCISALLLFGVNAVFGNNIFIGSEEGDKLIQSKKERAGTITFVTSENVYAQFDSTEGINVGDTLYSAVKDLSAKGNVQQAASNVPFMVVKYISSKTCSGNRIGVADLKVGDKIIAFVSESNKPKTENEVAGNKQNSTTETQNVVLPVVKMPRYKRPVGSLSISSYSNISNTPGLADIQRWRYSLSLDKDSLFNSPVSFRSHVDFVYRTDQWSSVTNNLGSAARFYDFAFQYDMSKTSKFMIGRAINPKTSSLGAVDGLQLEAGSNRMGGGVIVGSRPDFADYGFNAKLFEFGGYVFRNDTLGSVPMENTVGIFQQTNDFKTDRRFLYYQHSNSLSKSLNFFVSSEFDLYKREKGIDKNTFEVTSIFAMTSFTPANWLSLYGTYDARKNVVYYETFKNIADSILASSMHQGLGLRLNLRPLNYIWLSGNFNYRFGENDPKPTRNYGGTFTYTFIPLIQSSFYFSYNIIESAWVNGTYFSTNLNKDFFDGAVNVGIGYRNIRYIMLFSVNGGDLVQKVAAFDLTWRIFYSVFLSMSYEGTFQDKTSYSNLFTTINFRF